MSFRLYKDIDNDNIVTTDLTVRRNLTSGTVTVGNNVTTGIVNTQLLVLPAVTSTGPVPDNSMFSSGNIPLLNGIATNIMTVTLDGDLSTFSYITYYHVRATDGVDVQTRAGYFNFVGVRKGGTVTATASTTSGPAAVSAGTLTVSVTSSVSGLTATLKITATSSLAVTTLTCDLLVLMQSEGPIPSTTFP